MEPLYSSDVHHVYDNSMYVDPAALTIHRTGASSHMSESSGSPPYSPDLGSSPVADMYVAVSNLLQLFLILIPCVANRVYLTTVPSVPPGRANPHNIHLAWETRVTRSPHCIPITLACTWPFHMHCNCLRSSFLVRLSDVKRRSSCKVWTRHPMSCRGMRVVAYLKIVQEEPSRDFTMAYHIVFSSPWIATHWKLSLSRQQAILGSVIYW